LLMRRPCLSLRGRWSDVWKRLGLKPGESDPDSINWSSVGENYRLCWPLWACPVSIWRPTACAVGPIPIAASRLRDVPHVELKLAISQCAHQRGHKWPLFHDAARMNAARSIRIPTLAEKRG